MPRCSTTRTRTPTQPLWNPPARGDTIAPQGTYDTRDMTDEEKAANDRRVGAKPKPGGTRYGVGGGDRGLGYATAGQALGRASKDDNPLTHDQLSAPPPPRRN